jgi:hypothetical protein
MKKSRPLKMGILGILKSTFYLLRGYGQLGGLIPIELSQYSLYSLYYLYTCFQGAAFSPARFLIFPK